MDCAQNPSATAAPPRVVIIGGGFAGLETARRLAKSPVAVTLVDRRNFHLFQPLLYQVATAGLSPANIASPLRYIVRKQRNCEVMLSPVTGFDVASRRVLLEDGDLPYDWLVLATGASHSYFGRDDWAPLAPGLKTIEDATEIRRRIYSAFESAERECDPVERARWLTFVIVGAGPTGVELAGALAEIARHTLTHDFRHINPSEARILLVEAGPHVLAHYPEELSRQAADRIRKLGIDIRAQTKVTDIQSDHVVVQQGETSETIPTRTVLWAAGVRASPLGLKLAEAVGLQCDRAGRIPVQPDLSVAGHPDLFAIGDVSNCPGPDGKPLPGLAPVAIQQGRYVAGVIHARVKQQPVPPPFRYRDRGSMATIGRAAAVAQFGRWKSVGFLAWLLWLFIHLVEITLFTNRLLVLMQWVYSYITYNRAARLITQTPDSLPPVRKVAGQASQPVP